jgi:hypothetical protein
MANKNNKTGKAGKAKTGKAGVTVPPDKAATVLNFTIPDGATSDDKKHIESANGGKVREA